MEKPVKKKWINPLKDRTRVIPFVVPDQETRRVALGSLVGQKWRIKRSFEAIIPYFQPIKKPQPGQNLDKYEEDGQDFPLFSSIYRNYIQPKHQIIYIATFKCNLTKAVLSRIKKKAKQFFHGIKIKMHNFSDKVDLNQFDQLISDNNEKYYDAAKMNVYFTKHLPKNAYSIAIITSLLIYNGDSFKQLLEQKWIFGLGSIKDRTSLTTFEQIVKKGYGKTRQEGAQDQSQFNIDFLSKVINHELCHTFGMKHCIYYTCLMNGSSGYNEAIKKVEHLCPVCLRKLQVAISFDIAERYQILADEKSLHLAQLIRSKVQ